MLPYERGSVYGMKASMLNYDAAGNKQSSGWRRETSIVSDCVLQILPGSKCKDKQRVTES